jgi:Zn-finger nucleic acid-binding protein
MNCPNCGARMRFVDQRRHLVCEYCATIQFLDHCAADPTAGPDRVRVLGPQEQLACSVCGVLLTVGVIERCQVLYCTTCRGVLSDRGTFADIVRRRRRTFEGPRDAPRPLDPTELRREIACPKCSGRMDVHPYYGPGSVVIDTCARCGAVWLDLGELGAIERAPGAVR